MVDIHAHILPGVDDGSFDMEQSLLMAEMAVRAGTTAMAATFHSNQEWRFANFESERLIHRFFELKNAMKAEGIPLRLARGMEIFVSDPAVVIRRIRSHQLIPLNKTTHYLVEFAFHESPMLIDETLREMIRAGFHPVIAHPERYYCVQENPNYVYEWIQLGAMIQVNKGSFLGRFGRDCEVSAATLLAHHMIHCVASDCHSHEYRTPDMLEVQDYLRYESSEKTAELLLSMNPSRILMGRRPEEPEAPVPVTIRHWY